MKNLKIVALVLISVALVSCAKGVHVSKKPTYPNAVTSEMRAEFDQVGQAFMSGQLDVARAGYQTYISSYGYNELTDEARFKLGEIEFIKGNYNGALSYYREAFQNLYNPEIAPKAQFKTALSLRNLKRPGEGLVTLEQMERRDMSNLLALRVDSLAIILGAEMDRSRDDLIKWYLFLLDDYKSLHSRDQLTRIPEELVAEEVALVEVQNWVQDSTVTKGSVDNLPMNYMKGKPSGGYVLYKMALISYAAGDFDGAKKQLKTFTRRYPKHDYVAQANTMLAELKGRSDNRIYKVGVILPLSGRFELYGNSTLQGIQCAVGLTPPCTSPLNIELVVKDSMGDPGAAAQAVTELVGENVIAIIGPLMSSTVVPAAKMAQELKTPLVSLSQKRGIERSGNYIFKHALTPEDQVSTLVDYGVATRGVKNFGILYPSNNYGILLSGLFKAAVQAAGGQVVFEREYSHEDLRVNQTVREMGNFTTFARAPGAVVEGIARKFTVPSNVDAIFIPDSYKAVRYVVLAVNSESKKLSPDLFFMGVNRWNNPGLVSHDLGLLEGSVFVDGFYKDSSDITTRGFVQSFIHAYTMEPTILEAQAYDAARIVTTGIQNGGSSRSALQASISNIKNMTGVTGNIRIAETGETTRKLFILTVKNGVIAELSTSRGIIKDKNSFPYSRSAKAASEAKYDGKKMPDLTVRTSLEKYEPIDFYKTELE